MKTIQTVDIDKKIDIWEKPAGYSEKSKLDYMDIDYSYNRYDATVQYARAITNTEYVDISRLGDTFTYLHEIKGGYENEEFTDIPYLIPYPVEGSKEAVIVLSGGGFAYKTIDGSVSGGKAIASRLNKAGISAFLLHYRTNPYQFPIPMLDTQRAVRYLRYHKDQYGIDDDKIYLMGFSAGAYAVGAFVNQYMGKNNFPDEYETDEIDGVDDSVNKAAFIYPQLTFNYHLPMLSSVLEKEKIDNQEKRESLLKDLDLKNHISNTQIWQFIAYSNKDSTIPQESVEDYIKATKDKGVNMTRIFIPDQEHGFSDDLYLEEIVAWLKF